MDWNDIKREIERGHLGQAIRMMAGMENDGAIHVKINRIRDDYRRMLSVMESGAPDPERETVYKDLLRRAWTAMSDGRYGHHLKQSLYWSKLYGEERKSGNNWSITHIQEQLESFVSDAALAPLLDGDSASKMSIEEIIDRHFDFENHLFNYIVTSRQWTDATTHALLQLVLSPTVDRIDQQLIVSATMLSNLEIFDVNKFKLLIEAYRQSRDVDVKQRALVGWALTIDCPEPFSEEIKALVSGISADKSTQKDLTELQLQLTFCITAEADNGKIRDEIMPEIINSNMFQMGRNGLVEEKEDDPMEDILHPDAAQQNMEHLEQSFGKMMEMQKNGADIYFEGFAQMKRFSFFYRLCNWFMPFYKEHPDIRATLRQVDGVKFFDTMMTASPFCDSDKYSLMLVMRNMWQRLPEDLKDMLKRGEAVSMGLIDEQETARPEYRRRSYLQDIYRFYQLNPWKQEFRNPFAEDNRSYLFIANPLFKTTAMKTHYGEISRVLYEKKMNDDLLLLLGNYDDSQKDYEYYMLRGRVTRSVDDIEQALALRPNDVTALRIMARIAFDNGNYNRAATAYEQLMTINPEKRQYQLNYAITLTHNNQYDKAKTVLYKLNYDYPDNVDVKRAIAWLLVMESQWKKAEKIYDMLIGLDVEGLNHEQDIVNYAYCKWFQGKTSDAARLLRQAKDAAKEIDADHSMLRQHGISDIEIEMMRDLSLDENH